MSPRGDTTGPRVAAGKLAGGLSAVSIFIPLILAFASHTHLPFSLGTVLQRKRDPIRRVIIDSPSRSIRPTYTVQATAYDQSGVTASGLFTTFGEVASNTLAFGTRILLTRPVFGRSEYVVEDRIGWGTELDFYNSSAAACVQFGREEVTFSVLS